MLVRLMVRLLLLLLDSYDVCLPKVKSKRVEIRREGGGDNETEETK